MKSTICALNTELEYSKNILVDNQPLVSLGSQLSKLKSIKKLPSLLSADIFYAMDQAVMLKAYPEAISLGGRLILAGILASLGINNNRIISGIYNCIPVPSKLRYVVEKSRQATFMSIAGFVCNYTYLQ